MTKTPFSLPIATAFLLGSLACVIDNPRLALGTDDLADQGSSGPTAGEESEIGSESGSEAGSEAEVGSTTSDMAETELCPIASEAGDACQTCVDLNCCEDVAACELDSDCTCLLDCLLGGSNEALCQLNCGSPPALPSLNTTLDCLDQHCSDDCPTTV